MRVSVYVEGGGDQDRTLTACRKAFHSLLDSSWPQGSKAKIVACGGRDQTFNDFRIALRQNAEEYPVLLVDSEDGVTSADPWPHLRLRDGWDKPEQATAEQGHLMVQCMESWFLADIDCLNKYFGQGFSRNALPANPQIEAIPKRDVAAGLENAVKATSKGRYHKVRDGFQILADLDFEKVCGRSPRARAFRDVVHKQLGA